MGQDFYRRMEGYNKVFIASADATLARNATLTLNAPAGPGRVEQVIVMIDKTSTEKIVIDGCILTIDGVTILNYDAWRFFSSIDAVPFWGPISGYQRGTNYTTYQVWRQLDYESSLSLSIQNVFSQDPSHYFMIFWGRIGA